MKEHPDRRSREEPGQNPEPCKDVIDIEHTGDASVGEKVHTIVRRNKTVYVTCIIWIF